MVCWFAGPQDSRQESSELLVHDSDHKQCCATNRQLPEAVISAPSRLMVTMACKHVEARTV